MKKLLLLLALVMLVPCAARGQELKEVKTHVYYFASDDLGGRKMGSEGMFAATRYVVKECKKYGLSVSLIPVENCHNVVAWIKGKNPEKIIVIGAHLDHLGKDKWGRIYNGADDNASGSAAVLALAKRFSQLETPNFTITFQWYTGEEVDFNGSRDYVNNPRFPEKFPDIKKHIFMLNLDMVGRLRQKEIYREEPVNIDNILSALFKKYSFAKSITFRDTKDSDQHSFSPYMPVIFLHTGLHSDYHKPSDDAKKINYEGMIQVIDYAYDLVNLILGEPEIVDDDYILYGLPIYDGKP